jgi:glycosidase
VESRIGDEQQLRSLIDQAHGLEAANGHGMRVMFDYVMNHVDIASGLYKQKPGWFATDKGRFRLCEPDNLWNHPYWGTRCSFTDYLPAFDLSNPDARRWSVADALWWAEEYNVDGYRLDAIKHVPMEWLYELRRQLNESDRLESDSQFYLVGETYDYSNRDVLRRYIDPATKLDGQFDFPLRLKLCEAFFRPSGNLGRLAQWMAGNDGYYDSGEPALMVNWIGNHDIPRAIHFASGQITNCYQGSSPANGWHSDRFRRVEDRVAYERLAQTFAVLMTQSGIPLIYYGDEIGLPGGGDPDNRRPMIWDDNQLNEHQKALRQEVGKLARLRGEKKVLGRGRTQNYFADKDRWVYRRGGCESNGLADDEVVVAFNRSNFGRVVPLPSGVYRDLLNGGRVYGGQHYLDARDYVLLERLSSAQ